ncbi:FtsB family cell division protein [Intestinibacter sp.]|uniref:FtsB family cell division protein n=1 Tax=Intestinibacter sp. TaxID=1965304 RepID=UPI002A7590F6|nr:septum formation initiator family protein [Intestinibacter sp.]MDY2734784.1 septum formation initiator family protein [Intestinibacter sp.]MDY4573443.1 septum formation initiator family protein [Intestinibacter sp.]
MNLRKKFSGQCILIYMFVSFIIFTLIVGVVVQLQNIRDYKEEISRLECEINDTENQIKKFQNNKSYKNDDELERLARNQLGMVKKNEIIYLEK